MSVSVYVFVKSDASYADFAVEAANYFGADLIYIEKLINPKVQYVFYIRETNRTINVWIEYVKEEDIDELSSYNYGLRILIDQWLTGSREEAQIEAARDVFETLKQRSSYELRLLRAFVTIDHHIPPAHPEDGSA